MLHDPIGTVFHGLWQAAWPKAIISYEFGSSRGTVILIPDLKGQYILCVSFLGNKNRVGSHRGALTAFVGPRDKAI